MATSPNIVDLTGKYPYLAKGQLGTVRGLVVHHTASSDTATPQAIAAGWKKTGTSSQFIMGRDGTVYQMVPDGQKAYQIKPSWNPAIPWASNSSTIGIELIAKDDADVTPAQVSSLQSFALQQAAKYGFDPATNVVGHGEINGAGAPAGTNPTFLRQASEGMTAVTALRSYLATNPTIEAAYQPGNAIDAINSAVPDQTDALAFAPVPMPERPTALDARAVAINASGSPDDRSLWAASANQLPMPGRPAGLDTAEPGTAPAKEALPMVKLPSGQMIPVGSYPSNDGKHQVIITDDGQGNAVVSKQLNLGEVPGLIDPLHESGGTVAGKAVQTIMKAKATDAVKVAAPEIGQVLSTASNAISAKTGGLGQGVIGAVKSSSGFLLGFGDTLHNMFGRSQQSSLGKLIAIGQAVAAQRSGNLTSAASVASSVASIMPANENKAGGTDYLPHLDTAGDYVPNPNRLRADAYSPGVSSTPHAAYQVAASGLGALSDERTSNLIAPANGVTLEYGGHQNGRDIMLVGGEPDLVRPPIVVFNPEATVTPNLYSPKPMAQATINFTLPTTMSAALSGTPMADLGSAIDQHLSAESARVGSAIVAEPKPTGTIKSAPVSTAIIKPHTPSPDLAPTPTPKPVPVVSHPNLGTPGAYNMPGSGPGNWADFSAAFQPAKVTPVAAPKPMAPVAPAPTRTITESVVNPAYAQWQATQNKVMQTVTDAHERRDIAEAQPLPSPAQVPPPPKTITQTRVVPVQPQQPAPAQSGGGGYTIQKGDTLSAIAARNGTTVAALARANGISNPNVIYAGQSLNIPKTNQPTISQPTTKTAGAPAPANNSGGSAGSSQPIYVDKTTGKQLTKQVIDSYNADTNTWGKQTVYL